MGNPGLQMAQNCLDYPGIRMTRVQITDVLLYSTTDTSSGQNASFSTRQGGIHITTAH